MRLTLGILVLVAASGCRDEARPAAAAPVAAGRRCLPAPPTPPARDLERNLYRLEEISNALKKTTMGGVCRALRAFDFDALRAHLTPAARAQRLFPRAETLIVRTARTAGTLVRPADPTCYGDAADFAADLRELIGGWTRVDRCFFKSFRIFASRARPRRATAELHLWLGGVEASGARVGEKGDIRAEMEEDAGGRWRFARIDIGERERFRANSAAFADQTERAGIPTDWVDAGYRPHDLDYGQQLYGAIAIGDYDGDGWPDLYVVRAGKNLLLRNRGDGRFEDVTDRAGVGDPGNGQAAIFADFDNDGDLDLFVVNAYYRKLKDRHARRPHQLYRNNGGGTFTRVPVEFGGPGPASGAAVADYDGDGLLDIYVTYYQDIDEKPFHHYVEAKDGFGNRLYRNLGSLRFGDVTDRAGVRGSGWSYAAAWADYDEDGKIDLYVANDFGDSYLFRNRGDGTFEEVAAKAGVQNSANGMSADWGDFDNDGRLDLYVANMYSKTGNQVIPLYPELDDALRRKLQRGAQGNALFRNRGDGTFKEKAREVGVSLAGWAWGSNFFDYDNDGWLDVYVANGLWAGQVEDDY